MIIIIFSLTWRNLRRSSIFYLYQNDLEKAEYLYPLGLGQHPGNTGLMLKKAQYYIYCNKNDRALRILSELSAFRIFRPGSIHDQGKPLQPARKVRKGHRAIHPGHSGNEDLDEIYSNIAFEYENLGKYDRALEFLLKAIEFNPENDALYMSSASVMKYQGKQKKPSHS